MIHSFVQQAANDWYRLWDPLAGFKSQLCDFLPVRLWATELLPVSVASSIRQEQ